MTSTNTAGFAGIIIDHIPDESPAADATIATSVRFSRADHAHLRHVAVDLGPADSVVRRSLRLLGALPLPEGTDDIAPLAWAIALLRSRLTRWAERQESGETTAHVGLPLDLEEHVKAIERLTGLRSADPSRTEVVR